MNQQVTKKCHWVPQSYLKAFALKDIPTSVFRFNVIEKKEERRAIDNVPIQYYLYVKLNPNGKHDDSLEQYFSKCENGFKDQIWQTLSMDPKKLTISLPDLNDESVRDHISQLIAMLYLRTPRSLEQFKNVHQYMLKALYPITGSSNMLGITTDGRRHIIAKNDYEANKKHSSEDIKNMWIDSMDMINDFSNTLKSMNWSVISTNNPTFITSDDPVTIINKNDNFPAFRRPDTDIYVPISPYRVLRINNNSNPHLYNNNVSIENTIKINNIIRTKCINYYFSQRSTSEIENEIHDLIRLLAITKDSRNKLYNLD